MNSNRIHLLLHSERFHTRSTKNTHYLRAWRREILIDNEYKFESFILTHSTDSGLYYEEAYRSLESLSLRKSGILNYWKKKH